MVNTHRYTLPHGGIVTSPARAAAAVFLVLVSKGVPFPITVVSVDYARDAYIIVMAYNGEPL